MQGLRLLKPPYGRITAYNMNKGEIAWQIPNGDTPANVKNNPALKGVNIPKTGSPSNAGPAGHQDDCCLRARDRAARAILHAYDKATGAEIFQTPIPGPQVSLPMTYMLNGRQFIVLARPRQCRKPADRCAWFRCAARRVRPAAAGRWPRWRPGGPGRWRCRGAGAGAEPAVRGRTVSSRKAQRSVPLHADSAAVLSNGAKESDA